MNESFSDSDQNIHCEDEDDNPHFDEQIAVGEYVIILYEYECVL